MVSFTQGVDSTPIVDGAPFLIAAEGPFPIEDAANPEGEHTLPEDPTPLEEQEQEHGAHPPPPPLQALPPPELPQPHLKRELKIKLHRQLRALGDPSTTITAGAEATIPTLVPIRDNLIRPTFVLIPKLEMVRRLARRGINRGLAIPETHLPT